MVRIDRDSAYFEHAVTAATCLLSGLEVFCPTYSTHDRALRVLKGLHGFHVFAHEYWIDCVLHALSPSDVKHQYPKLLLVLHGLSDKLASLGGSSLAQDEDGNLTLGNQLELLKGFPALYSNGIAIFHARNQKKMDYGSREEG